MEARARARKLRERSSVSTLTAIAQSLPRPLAIGFTVAMVSDAREGQRARARARASARCRRRCRLRSRVLRRVALN